MGWDIEGGLFGGEGDLGREYWVVVSPPSLVYCLERG